MTVIPGGLLFYYFIRKKTAGKKKNSCVVEKNSFIIEIEDIDLKDSSKNRMLEISNIYGRE